jgi:hypothetical protein
MANNASQKELDDLLAFPDPLPPGQPLSPEGMLSLNLILVYYTDTRIITSDPAEQSGAIFIPI